jgi:hypothetical protein
VASDRAISAIDGSNTPSFNPIFRAISAIDDDGSDADADADPDGSDARRSASTTTSGPFYTSECRGGVERRQLELKGAEGGY